MEKALSGKQVAEKNNEEKNTSKRLYKRLSRHYLADEVRKENRDAILTAAAYHKQTKILVTGSF